MTGEASWRVRVTRCGRFSVNALPELLDFIGMALRALCRRQLSRGYYFVMVAMAGFASLLAQRAVHAVGHMGSLVGVASGALNLGYFRGMRIVLDARVAIFATQNTVDAGCMLRGINRDAFAVARCHSCLAMAGQAALILLERLRRLYLRSAASVCRGAD